MSKHYITTEEIIEKGNELNKKHYAYKNALAQEKPARWKEFYEAWQEYRAQLHAYIQTNPIEASDLL